MPLRSGHRPQARNETREQCLARAAELEWQAEECPDRAYAAVLWRNARTLRSMALTAPSRQD